MLRVRCFEVERRNACECFGFDLLELSTIGGPEIENVRPGSSADAAGLTRGDKIIAVNGVNVKDPKSIRRLISEKSRVKIMIERMEDGDGRSLSVPIAPPKTTCDSPPAVRGRAFSVLTGSPSENIFQFRRADSASNLLYRPKSTTTLTVPGQPDIERRRLDAPPPTYSSLNSKSSDTAPPSLCNSPKMTSRHFSLSKPASSETSDSVENLATFASDDDCMQKYGPPLTLARKFSLRNFDPASCNVNAAPRRSCETDQSEASERGHVNAGHFPIGRTESSHQNATRKCSESPVKKPEIEFRGRASSTSALKKLRQTNMSCLEEDAENDFCGEKPSRRTRSILQSAADDDDYADSCFILSSKKSISSLFSDDLR